MCHAEALQPPQAARQPKQLLTNGDEREDCYYWLRDDDRKAPEVTTRRVMFRVQKPGRAVGMARCLHTAMSCAGAPPC